VVSLRTVPENDKNVQGIECLSQAFTNSEIRLLSPGADSSLNIAGNGFNKFYATQSTQASVTPPVSPILPTTGEISLQQPSSTPKDKTDIKSPYFCSGHTSPASQTFPFTGQAGNDSGKESENNLPSSLTEPPRSGSDHPAPIPIHHEDRITELPLDLVEKPQDTDGLLSTAEAQKHACFSDRSPTTDRHERIHQFQREHMASRSTKFREC
jgi:hypothetical protein